MNIRGWDVWGGKLLALIGTAIVIALLLAEMSRPIQVTVTNAPRGVTPQGPVCDSNYNAFC